MKIDADLDPPLGYPGGRCHVVDRIDSVNPPARVRDDLQENALSSKLDKNQERMVYKDHKERGPGEGIDHILFTPHAQFRMDLRGVTVPETRLAFKRFIRKFERLREKKDPLYLDWVAELKSGKGFKWTDPQSKQTLVFALDRNSTVKVITTYWQGEEDPPPTRQCIRLALLAREMMRR